MSTATRPVEVAPEALGKEVAARLEGGGRLAALIGAAGGDGVRLLAAVAGRGELGLLETTLAGAAPSFPSLTVQVPAADWYERELHDLFGVIAEGHPDLDPLVLPREATSSPPCPGRNGRSAPIEPSAAPLGSLVHGEGLFTIPYGPVRSGVFEAIEYVVETPGEDIPRVQTRPHYKHRGVEAAFVGRSPEDGALIAERVEGVASVAHAVAYCEAVEQICGVSVPVGAQLVRALHAELERIANHLDSTLRHTEAAGQAVALARLGLHKERLMRLRAELCGSRFGRGVVVPGGVSGPPARSGEGLVGALDALERALRADLHALMGTPSFLDRLRGTGVLPRGLVTAHGGVGPIARASGLPEDVRAARPYGAYRRLGFEPARHDEGDALARQRVRDEEVASSFHLLRQIADELDALDRPGGGTAGAWSVPVAVADGEGFGWAEAPQGEILTFVRIEDGALRRVKPRSASFHNLSLFTAAFPNDITTDFAFIEASFGLSIAGVAG